MSSSLMTLIQASLLQERTQDAEGLSKMPYPTAVGSAALGAVKPVLVKREAASPQARAGNVADSMQQLVVAVAKLSDVDQMLEQVQQTVPAEDGAAQKWYQVSLTSLQWTRKAQSERVQAMLQDLKSVMLSLQNAAAELPMGPTRSHEDAGLVSMIPVVTPGDVPVAAEAVSDMHGGGAVAAREGLHDLQKVGSLRNDLETLRERDPDCCLIVRNIKRLGLESAESLKEHFGRFGEVAEVYCAHSFEKPNAKRRHGRVRPAALGFVVMATMEGAEKVLAAGGDQSVSDVCINVRPMGLFVEGEPQTTD